MGDEPRHIVLDAASVSATNAVQEVIRVQSKHWKCMGYNVNSVEGTLVFLGASGVRWRADFGLVADAELVQGGKPIPIAGSWVFCLTMASRVG